MHNPGDCNIPSPGLPAYPHNQAYNNAYEELFGGHESAIAKAAVVSHPLFQHLLAAHVACLRVATPLEQQHIIDRALAQQHNVEAKYLALLNHLQLTIHPAEDEELNSFMMEYILLLQTFKEELQAHLKTQALEAITCCQEIERALFNLTGVSPSFEDVTNDASFVPTSNDNRQQRYGLSAEMHCLDIHSFLPSDIHKNLRQHVRQQLKQELKGDYFSRLKEVRDEIFRKRRAGKLPEDTTNSLRDWWLTHEGWPYPTEEDKAQLMEETGLELKQINNWFINQRKRNWQNEMLSNRGAGGTSTSSYGADDKETCTSDD
ncbi:hypothetical protein KP509_21G023400 [Ceratopteris richardii]|uniref:Homeobox domain-containing protein n=1 Tax=Ceratopteris richardii TaxID=49495 RepID=A0A8T2SBF3_CERRI|nr:hypothetical protein KP509_21G023400 [Ceratopteris richardii]